MAPPPVEFGDAEKREMFTMFYEKYKPEEVKASVKAEVESVKAEVKSVKAEVESAMQEMKKLVSMSLQSQQEVNEQLRVLSDRSGRGKSPKQPATTIQRLEA